MAGVDQAVRALRAGRPVVLPTDTVYGVCAAASDEAAVRRLYRLKERPDADPLALLAPDVTTLVAAVPELEERAALLAALLPAALTLVLPNPARRYGWLAGRAPGTIGVRVPALSSDVLDVLEQAGPVAATSANLHGGADPASLAAVPARLRAGCGALVDGGELPGVASTVLDLAGESPRVLREGAVPAAEALARVGAAG